MDTSRALALILTIVFAVLHAAVTALAARRLGKWAGFFSRELSGDLRAVFETGLGFIFLSKLIFFGVFIHQVSAPLLWGLWFLLLPIALGEVYASRQSWRALFKKAHPGFLLSAGVYLAWVLLSASLPASDRDELIYQLEVPRQILLAEGWKLFPDNFYAYFPQLANMLMLFGLGTAGETSAKLYHALFGGLTAWAIYLYGKRWLSQKMALFAAALFLSVPSVMVLMALAYVDLAYAFYAFLALVILLDEKISPVRKGLTAGFMAGAAAAIKYPGLQYIGLLLTFCFAGYLQDRDRSRFKTALVLPIAGGVLIFPYLVRNFITTGWPLFPFPLASMPLNLALNWSLEQSSLFLIWLGQYGTPMGENSFFYTLAAPFLVFIRARFNEPQFYDGFIGPVFLMIPFLLVRAPKNKTVPQMALFTALFLYYWAVTTKQIRFLIPVLPVLCLLLAYGLEHTRHKILRVVTALFFFLNLGIGAAQTWARNPFPFWLGRETKAQYLQRQLPIYGIYQEANKAAATGRVFHLHMKNYGYYLEGNWTGDFVFERYRLDQALKIAKSPQDIAAFFKGAGATHLLVDEAHLLSPVYGVEPEFRPLLQEFMSHHAQAVVRDRHYALYELHP